MIRKAIIVFAMSMAMTLSSTFAFSQVRIPFKDGEKLSYTVHYKFGVNADIAKLDMNVRSLTENGMEACHVTANLYTLKFGDSFYKIRDLFESKFYLNASLQPIWYHRDVQEKNYWAKNWYSWNPDASSVDFEIKKSTRPDRKGTLSTGESFRDIVNVIFALRSIDYDRLMNGEILRYPMIVDRQVNDITVRYVKKEVKKVPDMGYFRTVKLAISSVIRKDGSAGTDLNVVIDSPEECVFFWVADDHNRIPVFFTAPLRLGSINGRLSGYDGLSFPLNSSIQ